MEKDKGKVNMEEICEDRCFACKGGGGSLLICELKNCPKAYHAGCAGKDVPLLESGGRLPCKWHFCFICDGHSKYQCYCCPRAVCERCIVNSEFAKLRGTKGFCINCIKVLIPAEKQEADSEGDKVDLKNRNTFKGLLYEYWLIIKRKENLTLKHLCFAYDLLKSGEIHTSLSNPTGSDKCGYESSVSSSRKEDTGSEFSISPLQKEKRSNDQKASKKKQVKSKKLEYIGWGSKPLINFLVSIGKDTSKEISQWDVESIINKYINENLLLDVKKKSKIKKIVCDERLHDLFGKKTFMRKRIYSLLELHYRENAEFQEQDRLGYSSEEDSENDSNLLASKKQKKTDEFINPKKEVVIEVPRSCFASVVADNIKLVYLKRSVVMELLEEPESFESMLIGSFVKVKSDPLDCTQRYYHQLVQVTGVKCTSPQGKKEDIFLKVSNRFEDFPISKLSDGNFSEEECEDLSERVQTGQLQKLTLVEIEEKAKSLHQVITKNWIVRELDMLQNRIDQANERGRRAELFQFLERRELLKSEAEQKRLLEEVPKVIADVAAQEMKQGAEIPLISISTAKSETLCNQWGDNISSSGDKAIAEYKSLSGSTGSISASYGYGTIKGDEAPRNNQDSDEEESDCNDQFGVVQRSEPRQRGSQVQSHSDDVEQKIVRTEKASPIELSSDEDDNSDCSNNYILKRKTGNLDPPIWHCLGPKGMRGCPFSMSLLKHWGKISLYYLKFEVWNTRENEENATLLSGAVRCKFTDLLGNVLLFSFERTKEVKVSDAHKKQKGKHFPSDIG